jgi:hypothetical protein
LVVSNAQEHRLIQADSQDGDEVVLKEEVAEDEADFNAITVKIAKTDSTILTLYLKS